MGDFVPIVTAVASGTVDSIENVFINIVRHVPFLNNLRRRKELDQCLSGKVCIVTGANAGIGYATARKLAERGAHVVLACRSEERGRQAAAELSGLPPLPGCEPGQVEFAQLDLCSLKNVRKFAKAFNAQKRRLDVLVCNAGIMSPANKLVTLDGLEMQFQVNFLSHWLLAHELLSEQRKRRAKAAKRHGSSSAKLISNGSSGSTALTTASISGTSLKSSQHAAADAAACCGVDGTRLVMLSSLTHHAGSVQWADKQSANGYNPFTSYALSKVCNIIMAKEFQRRFDRHDSCRYGHDSAVAIHPGIVHTHLATGFFQQTGHTALPFMKALVVPMLNCLYPLLMRTPESSAEAMLIAATAPAGKVAGRYMHNDRLSRPDKVGAATSPDVAAVVGRPGVCHFPCMRRVHGVWRSPDVAAGTGLLNAGGVVQACRGMEYSNNCLVVVAQPTVQVAVALCNMSGLQCALHAVLLCCCCALPQFAEEPARGVELWDLAVALTGVNTDASLA
ncbi:hypothetical protein COO60DRAFT_1549451 [Scenedesmus sp. NREL 46B-D3]|nr:hypothetical protein COO60DRAFT_1549451 [Scenedesmus sp. NREL 46B-D3]